MRNRAAARFHAAFDLPAETGGPIDWFAALERLAEAFMDFQHGLGRLREMLFHDAFTLRRPMPARERPASYIEAIIRAGREAGQFDDVDAEPTARLLFAAMHDAADAVGAGADRTRELAAATAAGGRALATMIQRV